MSADRRTKAELLAQLDAACGAAAESAKALRVSEEARKREAEGRDDEAVAVERCVKALRVLRDSQRAARQSSYGFDHSGDPQIERVLSYLRRRFGLPDQAGEVDAARRRADEAEARAYAAEQQLHAVRQSLGGVS